jgi:hypothetical protein
VSTRLDTHQVSQDKNEKNKIVKYFFHHVMAFLGCCTHFQNQARITAQAIIPVMCAQRPWMFILELITFFAS